MTDITFYSLGTLIIGLAFCWILSIISKMHRKEKSSLYLKNGVQKWFIEGLENEIEILAGEYYEYSKVSHSRLTELGEEMDRKVEEKNAVIKYMQDLLDAYSRARILAMGTTRMQNEEVDGLKNEFMFRETIIKELQERIHDTNPAPVTSKPKPLLADAEVGDNVEFRNGNIGLIIDTHNRSQWGDYPVRCKSGRIYSLSGKWLCLNPNPHDFDIVRLIKKPKTNHIADVREEQ